MTQSLLARPYKQLAIPDSYHDFSATEEYKQLPIKIQKLFEHLEQITQNSNHDGFIQGQNQIQKAHASIQSQHFTLCNSFKRMAKREQNFFMQELICELKKQINKDGHSEPIQAQTIQQYQCSIRMNSFCVPTWTTILLKLSKNRRTLTLPLHDRTIDVYLREFLLRRSKKHEYCFVLENIGFAAKNKQYIYHIRFEEKNKERFEQLQSSIKRIIVQSQVDSLLRQINQQKYVKNALSKSRGQIQLFLTAKNIRRFNEIQQYFDKENHESVIVKQSEKLSEQTSVKASLENQCYTQVSSSDGCKIQVSKNDENLYRVKYRLKEIPSLLIKNFTDCYKANHRFLFRLKLLQKKQEKIPQGLMKYAAFYQKIIWDDKIYGQTFIIKHQGTDQHAQNTNLESFKVSMINIDHKNNRNFIQFMQITLKQTSRIQLQAKILVKFTKGFDSQAIEAYLLKFIDVFQSRNIIGASSIQGSVLKPEAFSNKFLESEYDSQQIQRNQLSKLVQSKQKSILKVAQRQQIKKKLNNQIDNLFSDNYDKNKNSEPKRVVIDKSYLRYRYPLGVVNKKGKIMKEHFLWTNWKRAEKGGLVCKNEQLVERQKKMFKLVIKKFGQTLLMGKNIINFSLPVVVFKKESHLQSLAKSYLYSPIFTEKAASISDPLQRMKFSVVLMITQNALSIHMEKPFNPILGETYQGWINGCPMYLQQISHHPPISAYYFLGRGYKKYGCIEPKISVGLNTGSGYSIFPHFVQFDDGMKIQYICAKIVIGGLLIGERTFNFQDKIYAYDRKHRYFASVKFGPIKKGFFSSSNQPQDYFWGEIYEVTPQFQHYFDQQKGIKPHPQQKHIIKKLSNFDGIWNSFVNINGEEVLNFQTDLPYQFQQEDMPLPSDSRYREDLSNLLAGDLQAAQIAKEEMEEIQRRDRRLREEYQRS